MIYKRLIYYFLLLSIGSQISCSRVQKEVVQIPLEDFFKNPEKSNMLISPNGEYISYIQNYKNRANIFCQNLNDGLAMQLTFDTVRGITNYQWVDNTHILYMLDMDGNETYHLFSIDIVNKKKVDLTPYENIKMSFLDIAPQKEAEIYICLNKRKKDVLDLYQLNFITGELKLIEENPGNISYWKEDFNGDIRLAVSTDGVNETILYKSSRDAKFKEVITINFKETLYPICFAEDGKSVYALSNLNRDKVALVLFDLETAKEKQIIYQNENVDVNGMSFSYKTHKPLFANYRTDKQNLFFIDQTLEQIRTEVKKKDSYSNFSIINYTSDDKKYLIKIFNDKSLGTYYIFDFNTNELKEIAEISPWLKEDNMANSESFEFKTRDGLNIQGYLTLPKFKMDKYPLLVIAQPGLWQRARWAFNPEVQFFANRGYAVITVNHRGVEGYGKKFSEAGYKEIGRKMQDDFTDAVYYLISKGIVDTARIGIYGMSFGGYFALNGLLRDSGLYKCAASYSGFTNLFSYIKEIPPYYHQYLDMIYELIGDPEKDVEYLTEFSPAFHTDRINVPVFIAHGEKDQRMSANEIDQFVRNLKKRNVKVNYLLIPDEGHGFRKEENKIALYTELESFFEENLMKK